MVDSGDQEGEHTSVRELCANGACMKTTEVEAKLDEGNIQEAESSLREGLSLNFEVCSSLYFKNLIFFPAAINKT